MDHICVAAILPVHGFGILVPHGRQSLLRWPCFRHLKHLPSFMSKVLSSVVSLSMSMASGFRSCFGNVKVFFGASFLVSFAFPWPSMHWVFFQFPWKVFALSYHPWSVVGGFSLRRIGLCSPRGNVSLNRSMITANSSSPNWDINSLNLARCSSKLPSPIWRCFMASRASPGVSYGENNFLRLLINFLYDPKEILSPLATLSLITFLSRVRRLYLS